MSHSISVGPRPLLTSASSFLYSIMSGFTAVNNPGAVFANQETTPMGLDPFAVLGLRPDDENLTVRLVERHYRLRVMPHMR